MEPPGETRFDPAFLERYCAGQRARVERIDAIARERVSRRQAARQRRAGGEGTAADRRASIATDFLTVYRTDADPRYVDLSESGRDRTARTIADWIGDLR